jgi:Na+/glutamate symporter
VFKYGFGTHLGLIYRDHPENFVTCMKLIYIQHASYHTCSGFVKLSLLARYLRMFKEGILRKICIAVMVLASIWTVYWIFASWFCCFPVRGYWYRTMTPTPKCWGLGYADIPSVMASMYAFGGTNMFLDTVIFIIPSK